MDLTNSPLSIEIMIESTPLKSRILVGRLAALPVILRRAYIFQPAAKRRAVWSRTTLITMIMMAIYHYHDFMVGSPFAVPLFRASDVCKTRELANYRRCLFQHRNVKSRELAIYWRILISMLK